MENRGGMTTYKVVDLPAESNSSGERAAGVFCFIDEAHTTTAELFDNTVVGNYAAEDR